MKVLDVLRPYVSVIKLVVSAALACFLFVSGCNYGQAKHEATIVRLEQDKALLQQANASWALAAEESNKRVQDNVKESERLQKLADKDAKQLEGSRESTESTIANNSIKLEQALREPRCNELLEMLVCPSVPLP